MTGLSLAILLSSLGTNIAHVGLPTLARAFNASFQQLQWVVLAYLLAMTALIVGAGRLGDLIGRRRLLLAGLCICTSAAVACGAASTLGMLVAARAVQGLGAAVVMSMAMALATEVVAPERFGRAMGLLGTTSAIGTALGPSLGGLLLAWFGWPALFLASVPLGVVTLWLVWRYLPRDRPDAPFALYRLDPMGTLLLAFTLAGYALAMTTGGGRPFVPFGLAMLLAAACGAALFAWAESKAAAPLIRLEMLRDPVLGSGIATGALITTVGQATLVLSPFYLTSTLGLNAAQVGMVMSIGPAVAAAFGLPAGRAVDHWGAHRTIVIGLSFTLAGCAGMPLMLPLGLGVAGYVGPLCFITAGFAFTQAANNTVIMSTAAPAERGLVSGMLNLSRNLGQITGASAMGMVFALGAGASDITRVQPGAVVAGMQAMFVAATVLVLLALALALVLKPASPGRH